MTEISGPRPTASAADAFLRGGGAAAAVDELQAFAEMLNVVADQSVRATVLSDSEPQPTGGSVG